MKTRNQLLKSFEAPLDQAHLDLLVDRTEGWPAGLHLAGLAIARSRDGDSFVEGFSGTDRDVADYLVSEVLESVSDEEREFIIETSILSRFDGDLCDAVTGREGGAGMLVELERINAFLIPLDREDRWFRYHHLFGELVAAELHRTRPEAEVALHGRAFEWLREHGEIADAVRHGLAAGEVQAAADLLCSSWRSLMHFGRSETARLLIASFPEDVVADHQPFAVAAAGVSAMTGQTEAAKRWLEAAETGTHDGPRPDGMASTASSVGLIRGTLAPEGVDAALADGRTALELEPVDSPHRPLAAFLVGRSLVMRGDVDQATEFLEEAGRTGGTNERAYALAELSLVQLGRGDAEQALTTAEASRTLMHETGGDSLFITATAHGAKALAAIHLGDERGARADLRAAREPMAAAHAALPMDATRTRLILARAAIELDEAGIALGYLREAEGVIRSVTDVGVMRQEHAELMARVDALESRADGDADDEFTERELQVLAMLPSPLTVREIAEELFVSRNTIKTHTRRLYRKLNAASRKEAVLIASDRGLLQAGDDAPAS